MPPGKKIYQKFVGDGKLQPVWLKKEDDGPDTLFYMEEGKTDSMGVIRLSVKKLLINKGG